VRIDERHAISRCDRHVQPGSAGVGDEERGDGQVQLVGQVVSQELTEHHGTALDEEPVHRMRAQVVEDHLKGRAAVDPVRGGVGEELGRAVEVAAGAEGDPERLFGQAARHTGGPPGWIAHPQTRVIPANCPGTDENRIDAGPDLVDPVQVSGPGQDQPLGRGVVQVSVSRDGAAKQHIRTHREPSVPASSLGTPGGSGSGRNTGTAAPPSR